MHQVKLSVSLTDEITGISPVETARANLIKIYLGYRTCYSAETDPKRILKLPDANTLVGHTLDEISVWNMKFEEIEKLVSKCLFEFGHDSQIEHASLQFYVTGVSRALTHQLVRHRIASYGQQSQRYVEFSDLPVVIPTSISEHENPEVLKRFLEHMRDTESFYKYLISESVPAGDARFVTPQAASSAITLTMNFRALMNFFSLRCCNNAQWEIRELANQMLAKCKQYYPSIFSQVGAKCLRLGYCPEGTKMCKSPQYLRAKRERATGIDQSVPDDGMRNMKERTVNE